MTDPCKAGLWDVDPDTSCPVCGSLPNGECLAMAQAAGITHPQQPFDTRDGGKVWLCAEALDDEPNPITLRQFLLGLSTHFAPEDRALSAQTLRMMIADFRSHARRLHAELQENAALRELGR